MITSLHLGLSYNCNLKCKHCFVDKATDNRGLMNIYKELINSLYEKGLFIIFYTYGEPLLSKNFDKITSYVKDQGLVQVLMTNGTLIKNVQDVIRLKKQGIDKVFISIDSHIEEKHDLNRGKKGAYKAAIKAITLLKDQGMKVGISCTVTNNNVNEIQLIYELGLKHNVDFISFLRLRENDSIVQFDGLQAYYDFVEEYLINHDSREVECFFHDLSLIPLIKELYMNNRIKKFTYHKYTSMNECHKNNTISIAPNGDVKMCNFVDHSIGNIYEQEIKRIVDDNYYFGGLNEHFDYTT